jgi:prolipoprotein diacylglyceryltransferase
VVAWYRRTGVDMTTLSIHPTQVYGLVFGLALFAFLAVFARRNPPTGRTAALFLMLHALGTSLLEFFRAEGDKRGMLVPGVLSWGQLLAIPVFFAGVAVWMIRKPAARAPAG